jgi:N,N'-diacetyllegionaminate synthase
MPNPVIVIAEAGVNHNGDLDLAKRLIEIAATAGADYVKFQTFNAERIVTRDASKAEYQNRTTDSLESQFNMLKKLELTPEMHIDLIDHCAKKSIKFLSTGFDIESVEMLVNLGQRLIKIPSGEITNYPYLRYVGSLQLPIILSTGMSTLKEISEALDVLESSGSARSGITVLHCTTEYPAPISEVNLRAIETIRSTFKVPVGYSDHTEGIDVSIGAVALGATVIEKHFTTSRSLPGPDHRASLEPDELAALIAALRKMEVALGDGVKAPTASELGNIQVARRSIVARTSIRLGEFFSESNLTTKRPGSGISPMQWNKLVGQRSLRDYLPDELIDQ